MTQAPELINSPEAPQIIKPNVLIVDDRSENLLIYEDILQKTNARLFCVSEPAQVLEIATTHRFACVLMNLHIGNDCGLTLMKQLSQIEGNQDTPFVIITAHRICREPIIEAYKNGAADFLFMPVLPEVLISKINVFIALYHTNHQLRQEISTRRKMELKLLKMAQYDALTGLPNRYTFTEHLNLAILRTKRNKTSLAIMFIDLDHFKQINDTYGHDAGDTVLINISARLSDSVRASDLVARLGGDEFVIIVENFRNNDNLALLAEKILSTQQGAQNLPDQNFRASLSIGIAVQDNENHYNGQQLLKNADVAMYQAKSAGRNGYQFFKG